MLCCGFLLSAVAIIACYTANLAAFLTKPNELGPLTLSTINGVNTTSTLHTPGSICLSSLGGAIEENWRDRFHGEPCFNCGCDPMWAQFRNGSRSGAAAGQETVSSAGSGAPLAAQPVAARLVSLLRWVAK